MAIMIAVLMTYHDCSMFNLWFDHCPNCLRQLFSDSKHLQIFQMSLVLMGAKLKFNGVGIESISGQLEQQQIACLVSANILKRFFWDGFMGILDPKCLSTFSFLPLTTGSTMEVL